MAETLAVGVTGAAGYIGSRVTADLLDDGHEVVPLDDFSAAQVEDVEGREIRRVDVRDRGALRDALEGVDAVFHLAAESDVNECEDDPERAFDVNVRGTENVAWLCREWGTPLVFPCSMAVFGTPQETPVTSAHPRTPSNHYGRTKAMAEADVTALAEGAYPAHVFVKSNLYGHHRVGDRRVGKHTVLNVFVDRALDGESLTVHRPGTQSRDFVHVLDVARAYRQSLAALVDADETGARTLPIASGDTWSVRELADAVRRVVREERGIDASVELVENPRETEPITGDFVVDTTEAAEAIGFEATHGVEATIREMVR